MHHRPLILAASVAALHAAMAPSTPAAAELTEATAPAGDSEVEGRRLLGRALAAHGGLDRFRSFGTLTYSTEGLPYSAAAPLDFEHTADLVARRHRMEGSSAGGKFVAGVNGDGGWTTDAEALGIPPAWVAHGNSYFVLMPFVFADAGANAEAVGIRTFDGEPFDAVRVTYDRGIGDTSRDDYVLYLDRDTGRLRLIDFSVTYGPMLGDTPVDEAPRRSLEFAEYQEVDGLLVPRVLRYAPWERTADGGRRAGDATEYTVSEAEFAVARPDPSLFEPPAGAEVTDAE